jgi:hypothetical protein
MERTESTGAGNGFQMGKCALKRDWFMPCRDIPFLRDVQGVNSVLLSGLYVGLLIA